MIGQLGVCSWSLQQTSPETLAAAVQHCGLDAIQLALEPIRRQVWSVDDTRRTLERASIAILSGMMQPHGEDYATLESIKATGGLRPDEHWDTNLQIARQDAKIAQALGLDLVTFHAGFLPHAADDPERAKLLDRVRRVADVFADRGVRLALETGQETAHTLLDALRDLDHPSIGVNFDPANMVLYGMGDPTESLRLLAPHILQTHIKDATPSVNTGQWGAEVPVGSGSVQWDAFFEILAHMEAPADLVIEREAGDQRVEDVRTAAALVRSRTRT